jgi:hypothetical protein
MSSVGLNALAIWDFSVSRAEGGVVLILGSNDFVYYHNVEIEFTGVTFCDLPETFSHAEFLLRLSAEDDDSGPRTIYVFAESLIDMRTEFKICATGVEVRVGTVYYYDRK